MSVAGPLARSAADLGLLLVPRDQFPMLEAIGLEPTRSILPRRLHGRPWVYTDQAVWISLATLAGLPPTTAPVVSTASGLPVGVQIIGPQLGDRTTIDFARLLEAVNGRFRVPPGFE